MNDVIFTGLPRESQMLKKTLDGLDRLKGIGLVNKIVFSTWKGYVTDEYRAIFEMFNVEVLEKTEPEDKGLGGHFFCQAKSLQNGLEVCDPKHWILKLRADTWIDESFIANIMRNRDDYLYKKPDEIFLKKVWIPYAEITKPFYMPDEIFYGTWFDVSKLLNYEKSYETMYAKDGGGETHIRRFVHPFIENYPIFKLMIKDISNDNLVRLFSPERFTLLKQRLTEERYLGYLAKYYWILYKYFRIRNYSGVMKWHQPYCEPQIKLNNNNFTGNFRPSKSFLGQRIFCYDDTWIHNLVEGRLDHDPTARRIKEYI